MASIVGLMCMAGVATAQTSGSANGGVPAGSSGSANGGVPSSSNPAPITINLGISNPFKGGDTLPDIITAVLNNIIEPIAAVVVVIMIIYSGFKYITAEGNPGKIKEANQGLLGVLIGTLILLGAGAISTAITGTLKNFISL